MKKRTSATLGFVIGAFVMKSLLAVVIMVMIFMFIGKFIKK